MGSLTHPIKLSGSVLEGQFLQGTSIPPLHIPHHTCLPGQTSSNLGEAGHECKHGCVCNGVNWRGSLNPTPLTSDQQPCVPDCKQNLQKTQAPRAKSVGSYLRAKAPSSARSHCHFQGRHRADALRKQKTGESQTQIFFKPGTQPQASEIRKPYRHLHPRVQTSQRQQAPRIPGWEGTPTQSSDYWGELKPLSPGHTSLLRGTHSKPETCPGV